MKNMQFYKFTAGAVFLFFASCSDAIRAEPKVGDRIGDWVFSCRALSATRTVCALNQTIVESKSKKAVLQLALRKLGKERRLALVVNVPLGVYLATGIGGKVDEGEQFSLVWQSCNSQGCQAALGIDDMLKQAMKAGSKLFIGFKPRPDAETFTVSASLKGVTAGLTALDAD